MHGQLVVANIDQNRDQWLAARRGKITATKIGIILGLNKYESPLSLWAKETGKIDDFVEDNEAMEFGRHNEALVCKFAAKKLGKNYKLLNAFYVHPQIPWAAATPDCVLYEDASPDALELLDAKTGSYLRRDEWSEERGPEVYEVQVVWQEGVMGIYAGRLGGLIGGDTKNIFTPQCHYDPETFELMVEAGDRFRQCVERDIPPEAGANDTVLIEETIRAHRKGLGRFRETEVEEVEELLYQLSELRQDEEAANKKLKSARNSLRTIENKLRMRMGNFERVQLPDGRILHSKQITVEACLRDAYHYYKLGVQSR